MNIIRTELHEFFSILKQTRNARSRVYVIQTFVGYNFYHFSQILINIVSNTYPSLQSYYTWKHEHEKSFDSMNVGS